MGRPPAKCGTFSAYKRHLRNGEAIDEACQEAARVQSQAQTEKKRQQRPPRPPAKKPEEKPPRRRTLIEEILVSLPDVEPPCGREDVLRRGLAKVSKAIDVVFEIDPTKLAPLLREQREMARELESLSEGPREVSLADELERARAKRSARAANPADPRTVGHSS